MIDHLVQVLADGRETFPFISKAVEQLAGMTVEEVQADPAKAWVNVNPEDQLRIKAAVSFGERRTNLRFSGLSPFC